MQSSKGFVVLIIVVILIGLGVLSRDSLCKEIDCILKRIEYEAFQLE